MTFGLVPVCAGVNRGVMKPGVDGKFDRSASVCTDRRGLRILGVTTGGLGLVTGVPSKVLSVFPAFCVTLLTIESMILLISVSDSFALGSESPRSVS